MICFYSSGDTIVIFCILYHSYQLFLWLSLESMNTSEPYQNLWFPIFPLLQSNFKSKFSLRAYLQRAKLLPFQCYKLWQLDKPTEKAVFQPTILILMTTTLSCSSRDVIENNDLKLAFTFVVELADVTHFMQWFIVIDLHSSWEILGKDNWSVLRFKHKQTYTA